MYATKQDIIDLYGDEFLALIATRGEETGLAGPLTNEAITDACANASSEADSFFAVRYPTPVQNPPSIVRSHVINIACHLLASTHDRMTEIIRQRYEDALRWLRDISTGRANLAGGDNGSGTGEPQPAPGGFEFISSPSLFKRENLR
ncbi:gp436 family protein [Aestuariivirga sp. YIM B02566]|uniref:DUF1320 domain-containing protein n=1 Tax=Taklimakanibacter albus TaxID=2800327 RepID=A0ACC5R6H0_9HYPH|nr:DUF1320 domain-containing protein [Aestuariivirga sp. YIM B02566]MBK1868259.1 DUF1320 domain-containing protein [Aestuariivirga sp. YIM B02566]